MSENVTTIVKGTALIAAVGLMLACGSSGNVVRHRGSSLSNPNLIRSSGSSYNHITGERRTHTYTNTQHPANRGSSYRIGLPQNPTPQNIQSKFRRDVEMLRRSRQR